MRHQGRIAEWNDDRGFGFVLPNGGGRRVFVHVRSFANRQRRPVGNELVTYELTVDARGRPQGVNVAFVGEKAARPSLPSAEVPGPGRVTLVFAATYLLFVAATVGAGRLPLPVLLVYLGASCLAYLAYVLDKAAAVQGTWRTREQTLHLFSVIGGWPGAILAQRTARHKTQKRSFRAMFWATVALNCTGFAWLLSPSGMRLVKSLLGSA